MYDNCWCKSSLLGFGGYMDFENAQFYRDHFHIFWYWGPAAGLGAGTCVAYLVYAIWSWAQNATLWASDEVPGPPEYPSELSRTRVGGVDMLWLDY